MTEKYTDKRIEERLACAIEEMTPNILDDLTKELDLKGSSAPEQAVEKPNQRLPFDSRRRRRGRMYKALAGCAAALLIFVGAHGFLGGEKEVTAVVGLDVNPSIEMSVDSKDRVIKAQAYNDEGDDILGGLDFEGSDISVACNAVVGVMLTRGYLTDLSNSILVSVQSPDEKRGRMLERTLSEGLNGYLEDTKIAAAILGQYMSDDKELLAFAEKNNISPGKAWLIRSLAEADGRTTEESLLKLSTQELILLGQEKKISEKELYGSVNTSEYITREEALRKATEEAGLIAGEENPDDKTIEDMMDWHRETFECDDGVIVYDVDFSANGIEYEYDINAKTGEVVSAESEKEDYRYDGGGGSGNSSSGVSGGSGGDSGSSGSSGNSGNSGGNVSGSSGGSSVSGGNSSGGNSSGGNSSGGNSGGQAPKQKVYYDDDDDDDYDDDYDDDHDDHDDDDDDDDDD